MLTKYIKPYCLLLIFCFLFMNFPLFGNAKAKHLVLDAIDFTESVNFYAVTEVEQQGMRLISHLIRITDHNQKRFLRNDIYHGKKLVFSYLIRDGKIYQIDDKVIVENNVKDSAFNPMLSWHVFQQIKSVLNKLNCTYKISTTSYNGVSCFKVIINLPNDPGSLAKLGPKVKAKDIPYVIELFIGKHHKFIYNMKFYDVYANELGNIAFGKVQFNPKYNPEIFKLPDDKELKVANKSNDIQKIYNPKPSFFFKIFSSIGDFFSLIFRWIDYNFYALTTIFSWIFLFVSIGCIVVAIFLKVKNR